MLSRGFIISRRFFARQTMASSRFSIKNHSTRKFYRLAKSNASGFVGYHKHTNLINNAFHVATQKQQVPHLRFFASLPNVKHVQIEMPALSPTMSEGNIVSWKKKEGDFVKAGDQLAEIETDKATVSFDSTEEGYLAKILLPSGSKKVKVGTPIAVLVEDKSHISAFKDYSPTTSASQSPPPPPPSQSNVVPPGTTSAPPLQSIQTPTVPHKQIEMPALSPTMSEGNIVSWKKKEGDFVKAGDQLAEIETDKATVSFDSTEEGYLAKILLPSGSKKVKVGTPIAVLVEDKSHISAFKDYSPMTTTSSGPPSPSTTPIKTSTPPPQPPPPPSSQPPPPSPSTITDATPPTGRIIASPLAKKTAQELGIDLHTASIVGTGPNQRIIKQDVLEYAQQQQRAAQQPVMSRVTPAASSLTSTSSFTDIPVSQIRRVTAQRLLLSKQTIPHYYLTIECNVDELQRIRAELNAKANNEYKLSLNDFIIKAAAIACRKVPEANSEWRSDDVIRRYHSVDINVAVNTDRGLFTPVIKDADLKGLATISNLVKEFVKKAQDNKLTLEDLQPGTFTISNLGMFGIKQFAAVINPPQACILAVGAAEKQVIVQEQEKEHKFAVATMMSVTLSCDHRVVDGAVGAKWLQIFKDLIENPIKLLL